MSDEATTLGSETPAETRVRVNVKTFLSRYVASVVAGFDATLLHLVPGLVGGVLGEVMSIPQVRQWEEAELSKALGAAVDLAFWGVDSLETEVDKLLKDKLHIQLAAAQADAQTALAQSDGNLREAVADTKTRIAIAAKGKYEEWVAYGRAHYGVA